MTKFQSITRLVLLALMICLIASYSPSTKSNYFRRMHTNTQEFDNTNTNAIFTGSAYPSIVDMAALRLYNQAPSPGQQPKSGDPAVINGTHWTVARASGHRPRQRNTPSLAGRCQHNYILHAAPISAPTGENMHSRKSMP